MRAERVVLDTNVLISAACWPADAPREALEAVGRAGGLLLFSDQTFDERQTRVMKAKFDPYASRRTSAVYLARLRAVSEWVWIAGARLGCRDPDDDKLTETALLGEADALATGDLDLLEVTGLPAVPIFTPAALLERLGAR